MRNGGRPAWKMCRTAVFVMLLALAAIAQAQQGAPEQPNSASSTAKPYTLPPDKLAQATALGRIRPAIHFGAEFWELAVLWLLLATGTATRMGQWSAARTARSWLQSAIFSALLVTLVFVVADLPVAAIGHTFSLHYGISIESWPAWLADEAKTLGLIVLLETPLLVLVFGLMRWTWSRRRYWLWFAFAVMPLMVLGTFLLPSLIEPLFDTFEPLAKSHPALVTELERVVARTGTNIPSERMFLMKASEKSNGLNAYVTGIGASKRIVVWDTTAYRMPMDEILFTFGHESGHYVLNHIPKGLALGSVGIFALFWATSRLAQGLVRHFGVSWRVNSVASLPGLAVLLLTLATLQTITEPIANAVSRYAEHEADVYGQEAVHGIITDPQKTAVASFNQLGAAYLDDPNPNVFIAFWTYDHPSIQSRAIFAAHYNPWAPGQRPRFFQK
jgi:STE24 endopeptidase